jgi:hypothetical protein
MGLMTKKVGLSQAWELSANYYSDLDQQERHNKKERQNAMNRPNFDFRKSCISFGEERQPPPNAPSDPTNTMRDELCNLIRVLQISDEDRDEFLDFVRNAPSPVVQDVCQRTSSNIRTACRENWEARLEEYINSKPPKYEDHKDRVKDAPTFLKTIWGEFIEHGVLYLDRLSEYDAKLIPAVRRYWQLHGKAKTDIELPSFPPPRQNRKRAVLEQAAAASLYSVEDILRAAMAEVRTKQRQHTPG